MPTSLLSDSPAVPGVDPKHVDEYFGLWLIEPSHFQKAVQYYNGQNLHVHVTQAQAKTISEEGEASIQIEDGIARIDIRGRLMKSASSFGSSRSTVALRRSVRRAAADPEVSAILLVMDTPGGTTAGIADLAAEIKAARTQKPVWAFVEDLTASAGMWLASQASRIFANNATALVGSIGTFAVIQDSSKAAEKLGVTVHVIRAGDMKGSMTPGTEVTDAQLAEVQRLVDSVNEQFIEALAEGRGMSLAEARALADGRIHPAAEAEKLGLIDGIQSMDQTLTLLRAHAGNSSSAGGVAGATSSVLQKEGSEMPDTTNTTEAAATIQQLKEACPDATAEFYLEQVEKGATVSAALSSYNAFLREQLAAEKTKHAEELQQKEEAIEQAKQKTPGVDALDTDADGSTNTNGDAVAAFDAAVRDVMKNNPSVSRIAAVAQVARRDPTLHQKFIAETNATKGRRVQRLIAEKYEAESA